MGTSSARFSHVAMLQELLGLEREVIAAYALAVDCIVDEPLTRETVAAFHAEQARHVRALETMLRTFGSKPSSTPPRSHVLIRDVASFTSAAGTTQVLELLRHNADVVVRRYQAVLASDLPEDVVDEVRRATNDQLRHRAWIAARVEAFARPSLTRPSHFGGATSTVTA